MIFQCLMSNSNFSLQIQTFSNLRKVVQIKPNQISNVKFKSNSNQTSFEAFPKKLTLQIDETTTECVKSLELLLQKQVV